MLVSRQAKPDVADKLGRTPLHVAAAAGNEAAARAARGGRQAGPGGSDGRHAASPGGGGRQDARGGTPAEPRGDRRRADDLGSTPLHDAARHQAKDVVTLLVRSGANTAVADAYGQRPADVARKLGDTRWRARSPTRRRVGRRRRGSTAATTMTRIPSRQDTEWRRREMDRSMSAVTPSPARAIGSRSYIPGLYRPGRALYRSAPAADAVVSMDTWPRASRRTSTTSAKVTRRCSATPPTRVARLRPTRQPHRRRRHRRRRRAARAQAGDGAAGVRLPRRAWWTRRRSSRSTWRSAR